DAARDAPAVVRHELDAGGAQRIRGVAVAAGVERAIRSLHGVSARAHEARERTHPGAADTGEVIAQATHCSDGTALGATRGWPVRDARGGVCSGGAALGSTRRWPVRDTRGGVCSDGTALGSTRRWPVRDTRGGIGSWYRGSRATIQPSHDAPRAAPAVRAGALHA